MNQDQDLVLLRAGALALDLAPGVGASIARFRHGDFDLTRPLEPGAIAERNPRATGGFPMIPFAGRIREGRFPLGGRQHQLALNFGTHPHAIHGNAWQRVWRVGARDGAAATLLLDHDPARDGAGAWPFAYRASLRYALAGGTMSVDMALENRDREAWPAGMGLHPYFNRTPEVTLRANVTGMWKASDTLIPLEHVKVPEQFDFARTKAMDGLRSDGVFTGWDGRAEITWPAQRLRMTITAPPSLGTLVVYSPDTPKVLCVEPQSHVPNAVNTGPEGRGDVGYRLLAPGEVFAARVEFAVAAI